MENEGGDSTSSFSCRFESGQSSRQHRPVPTNDGNHSLPLEDALSHMTIFNTITVLPLAGAL